MKMDIQPVGVSCPLWTYDRQGFKIPQVRVPGCFNLTLGLLIMILKLLKSDGPAVFYQQNPTFLHDNIIAHGSFNVDIGLSKLYMGPAKIKDKRS